MNIRILRLDLANGESLTISPGVTVIVGPNNAGKSLLLSEIDRAMQHRHPDAIPSGKLVNRTILETYGSLEEAHQWFKKRFRKSREIIHSGTEEDCYYVPGDRLSFERLKETWGTSPSTHQYGVGIPMDTYRVHLRPEDRLNLVNNVSSFSVLRDTPSLPLQRIFVDQDREMALSAATRAAFGVDISVFRDGGSEISLHLGLPQGLGDDSTILERAEAFRELPTVLGQGHGLMAFVGILMNVLAGDSRIVLIDEPEAFLHPPQARQLGRFLAELRSSDTQVILATHSREILQGVLEGSDNPADHSIARISRTSEGTRLLPIPDPVLENIIGDPLLRHGQILDGLFYDGAVICEAESDIAYYESVARVLSDQEVTHRRRSLFFAQCHSKDRVHTAVKALQAAEVPVASVVDIDILDVGEKTLKLFESHGGDRGSISDNLRVVQREVNQRSTPVYREGVKVSVAKVLGDSEEDTLNKAELAIISTAIKKKSGWEQLKKVGTADLKGTVAHRSLVQLLSDCAEHGMFIVPVGELEGFHAELLPMSKSEWLVEVLTNRLYEQHGPSHEFVRQVLNYLGR